MMNLARAGRRVALLITTVFVALATLACARNLPADKSAAALHRDLHRIVSMTAVVGWSIDRTEYEQMLPTALQSVCRISPDKRTMLLAWHDQRIAEMGGPLEQAYQKRGRKLSRVKALLEMTRIRTLLARSIETAEADCPFWLEPSDVFRSRQTTDDRWLVSAGGGGKFIVLNSGGDTNINAGGAGRLLVGRTIGTRFSILGGLEIGGSGGRAEETADGTRELYFAIDAVAPLIMRYHMLNSYLEIEGGPMYRIAENVDDPTPGIHGGIAIGGRTSRQRWIFPGVVFGLALERTFANPGDEPITMFKLGFRAELDLPW